jgi:PEP-CTERM motif
MTRLALTLHRAAIIRPAIACCLLAAGLAWADFARGAVLYNNDVPNTSMAAATRPASPGKVEIEAADDFIFPQATRIDGATFTGLLPFGAPLGNVNDVNIEIYRVFPNASTNPPDGNVVTRTNSPSDVALTGRDSAVAGQLNFTSSLVVADVTAANSVLNGINKQPNQTTGGEGPVRGEEVQFTLTFPGGITLPADHYFFKPEVGLSSGDFYWLSATRPIVGQFAFSPDLQAWIRNTNLDPDWERIGTDVVGGATPPTFNMAFSLSGAVVPEPTSAWLLAIGAAGLIARRRKRRS